MEEALIGQFSLAGRVAVVTGAASGIAQETARVLARAGARVAICDIDEAGLARTASSIGEGWGPGAPIVRRVDVSVRAEVDALAEAVMVQAGRLDVWVSAAAILVDRPIVEARDDEVDRILAVNLKSVYWCCAAAARAMKATGGGSIINLSSAGAESAVPGMSLYSMTKAAVNALTRNAAREFGPDGIRVNAIAPGWIDTPLANHAFRDASGAIDPEKRATGLRQRAQVSPLGITGVPQDIALAALYLASDASRFMTGQIVRPNGGVAMP